MGLFGFGKKPGLGIDISSDAIRAIELLPTADSYTVARVASVTLPKKLIVDDEITDLEGLTKALIQLRKQSGTAVKQVVAAVSGSQAISKQVLMASDLDDEAISEKIETEAEALIPFPIAEVRYDFESLGEHATMAGQQRVLVTATRTISVDTRVQALEDAGFKTQVMDVDNQAILRACDHLLPQLAPEIAASPHPILVLDIGYAAVQIIVIQQGEVIFTRYQSGGLNNLLGAIDNDGAIEHAQLMAKLRANETDDMSALVLQDFLASMAAQVTRGIQTFQGNSAEKEFAGVVVINAGATLPLMLDSIRKQVEVPVLALNPFEQFALPDKLVHFQHQGPLFVEAFGLALRSFVPWHM